MKTAIRAGEVIETTTPDELKHHLGAFVADWFQEQARGVGTWRFESQPVTVTAGHTVKLPATGDNECGPNNGFCVMVHQIRILGLSSGDVISVYRNSANSIPVDQGVMAATGTLLKLPQSGKALFLASGDQLLFQGTGLTATGDILIEVEGSEVPAPDAYKLLT